tara:strand:- start:84 stop:347 length:264 start_codon:yes stop_codon:yes gene_type:complete
MNFTKNILLNDYFLRFPSLFIYFITWHFALKLMLVDNLATGSAGFIGSKFLNAWLDDHDEVGINFDKLTYASNLKVGSEHQFKILRR